MHSWSRDSSRIHEGCTTAVMRSSVHPNSGFGGEVSNDSFYHYLQRHQQHERHQNYQQQQQQNIHHLPFLEQQLWGQKIYSPLSPLVSSSIPTAPGSKINQNVLLKDVGSDSKKQRLSSGGSIAAIVAGTPPHEVLGDKGDAEVMEVASPRIFDRRTVEARCQDTGKSGSVVVGARRRLSWMTQEELVQQHSGFQSSCGKTSLISSPSCSLPRLPIHPARVLSSLSSPLATPAIPASPDFQNPEPRSELEFATSPPTIPGPGATSSYNFAASSLGDGLLLDNDLFSDFHRPDSSSAATQLTSRTNPSSPDCNILEPNSVLDFATSPPRVAGSAATPSYSFAAGSVGGGVLLKDDLFSNFNHRNSSSAAVAAAELLGLEDDEEEPSPTSSTVEWFQQASPLWTDSLIDDLTETTPVDEVPLTDIPSSPPRPSTSELCYPRPSIDQQQSQDQGEEEANTTTTSGGALGSVRAEKGEALADLTGEVDKKLVNLLLASAEAVSTKTLSLVNPLFAQLGELASPEGTTMQRLAAYFTEGLAIRCTRLWPKIYQPLPQNLDLSEEENLSAFHTLNQVCPYIKFAHFTANDIILQAFEGCNRVHVIDFDIKQGLQWPALFHSLAARLEGPPTHVRVTGIGEFKDDVMDTGDRLAEFAEALDLPFEFHAVIDKLEDVRLWMLHVKEKETVAVNCVLQLHRALHDPQNGIKDMLGLIASTKPKVVAVVEQEASHNGNFFEGRSPRFLEAFQYYAAIFDSLNSNMLHDRKARLKVEKLFAMEIRNILGCEGPERTERHESIKTWRLHMHRGGFKSVPVGKRARTLARLLLEFFACKSYTISDDDEDEYVLTLGWEGRSLFTASAWAPKL